MTAPTRRYVGPPLLVPALVYVALFVASLILGGAVGAFSTPSTATVDVVGNMIDHAGAIEFVSVIQLGSAIALGVFTAAATSAVVARGIDVTGLQIARFGGYGAALLLVLSAVSGWCTVELAQIGADQSAKAASLFAFATGGPAHVVLFGLLLAGISVPTLIGRLVPRWISIVGLVLAAAAAVSSLSLAVDALQFLLPIVRFPGMIWIVAVAATLLTRTDERR